MRGEQLVGIGQKVCPKGSPPLARGTDAAAKRPRLGAGITPACAGNRKLRTGIFQPVKDHPRLRGEQGKAGIYFYKP